MKTARDVIEWALGLQTRLIPHSGAPDPDRATAARIATALRVLEEFEAWESDPAPAAGDDDGLAPRLRFAAKGET